MIINKKIFDILSPSQVTRQKLLLNSQEDEKKVRRFFKPKLILKVFSQPAFYLSSVILFFILNFNFTIAPLSSNLSLAQSDQAQQTQSSTSPFAQYQASLEQQLQQVLQQINDYQNKIDENQKQGKTLQNQLAIIDANIKKIELQIKATQIGLKEIEARISDTLQGISTTKASVDKSTSLLAAALREMDQSQQKSLLEVLLENNQLSDFFSQIVYLDNIQQGTQSEIANLKQLQQTLEKQQAELDDEHTQQTALLNAQQFKKQSLVQAQLDKKSLLDETKGKEANFKKLLLDSQKTAAQIRQQIYQLAGGGGQITFEQALQYANLASTATGIRPAFLLAILDYESKLGKNVGKGTWTVDMRPSERPIFQQITDSLGLDPNAMPVSKRQWYGWGGAMGPAQFLPSTWMVYKDRTAATTGHNPASPWNIVDAFVAAALKLTDAGAGSQTYKAEWRAAMIYFAGVKWSNPVYRFYGDDVMSIAADYQSDIDQLKNASLPIL